jgi:hypothetical protein
MTCRANPAHSTAIIMPLADHFFESSNYLEAAFWMLIGLVFAGFALRRAGAVRKRCAYAAAAFILFGGSDVVEASTGAWWRPWWLFAWKAVCVVALATLLVEYERNWRKTL